MRKIKWGILSTAKIGLQKVIPAIQQADLCEVIAIASRDAAKVKGVASLLNIPKTYDNYEGLFADPEVEAIYIPLPNHLHVEYARKALASGKHVLCEKPIALNSAQAKELALSAAAYPHLKLMEAFMYRFHPQWIKVKQLVEEGSIGKVKTIQAFFSYYNVDKANIRNKKEAGGGGLMDIGCYCISQARYILNSEPLRVLGTMDYDPETSTDRLCSGILDFGDATASFTCSTQLNPFQRFHIFGDKGSIEVEIPVNIPPDKTSRIFLHKAGEASQEITFQPVDQYTLQADAFAKAIIENLLVPTPFDDAISNMKVIDAIVESNKSGRWVNII